MDINNKLYEYRTTKDRIQESAKIRTGEKGFKELSTTCVALANAQGGQIMIGVEDKTKKPAPNQVIPQECSTYYSLGFAIPSTSKKGADCKSAK